MKTKIEMMNSYFDEQIAACAARSQALLADDRTDESNFEKIRANVYDIFRTMLSVAVAAGKGDANAVRPGLSSARAGAASFHGGTCGPSPSGVRWGAATQPRRRAAPAAPSATW